MSPRPRWRRGFRADADGTVREVEEAIVSRAEYEQALAQARNASADGRTVLHCHNWLAGATAENPELEQRWRRWRSVSQ